MKIQEHELCPCIQQCPYAEDACVCGQLGDPMTVCQVVETIHIFDEEAEVTEAWLESEPIN